VWPPTFGEALYGVVSTLKVIVSLRQGGTPFDSPCMQPLLRFLFLLALIANAMLSIELL